MRLSTLPDEATKASKARAILAHRDLVLSVQVLQEFYVQATRKSRPDPLTHEEAIGFIRSWRRFRTEEITVGTLDDALDIKALYQLSHWDAAVIAAAKAAGWVEVWSEDMNDGQDYGGVKVVNPFKT